MKVEVTAEFLWAPDGNNVRTVQIGEVLEGRGAEIALELGKGRKLSAESVMFAPPTPVAAPDVVVPPAPPPVAPAPVTSKVAKPKGK